jgi:hypothetical protein
MRRRKKKNRGCEREKKNNIQDGEKDKLGDDGRDSFNELEEEEEEREG